MSVRPDTTGNGSVSAMNFGPDLASEWMRNREVLLPALERGRAFFSEADVVDRLVTGEYQLFGGDQSAIVYTITEYPAARALVFLLAGGVLDEVKKMEQVLIEKARAFKCDRVEYCGRRGWVRALGYSELFSVGMKDI